MKKIALAAALLAAPVFAEDAAVETVDNVAVEQQHAAYEGFYFGLGVEAQEVGHKVEYTWPAAAGGGTDKDSDNGRTRLAGALVLGFGKKLQGKGFYAGIEAGLNFGPATNECYAEKYGIGSGADDNYNLWYDLNVKHNSFVPSLALRFGFVDCETKMMTYIKLGAAYSRVKATYTDWNRNATRQINSESKCNGITPLIALGVEKAFAKKMTGRLEAEYRFGHSKSTDGIGIIFPQNPANPVVEAPDSVKLTQKGTITLRAMFCYNVKI